MALTRINIHHVRNLDRATLPETGRLNVLHGANGSGKTSVLEAIYLLGMARSFRTVSARTLITHGRDQCVVQGVIETGVGGGNVTLGVKRELSGDALLRINGETVRTVSRLVDHLPLQVINAGSFDLLTGAPAARRQYLNWGVFHVEQRFHAEWQRFQRCIKQRNTTLRRDKLSDQQLSVWTRELVRSGTLLTDYRRAFFAELAPRFREITERLLPRVEGLELRLRQGWDRRLTLEEALAGTLQSDIEKGFTQVGPQRADFKIMAGRHLASDVLSRGQQKLVVCALKLAQGQLLQALAGRRCTYLVDDLPSELDEVHSRKVGAELEAMETQVFITCVGRDDVSRVWPMEYSSTMFHVEHGEVYPGR